MNVKNDGPTAPTNLAAVASAYNKVDLSWGASTDKLGVKSYSIIRNGVTVASVPASTTTYSDTNNVQPNTSYSYYVFAINTVGNYSASSNTQTVTTPAAPIVDTTAPSAPSSLNAQVATSTQINLSWIAPPENDIASYNIYRGSAKIASNVTSTSFGDIGLTPGSTYDYYVRAVDTSSNESINSNLASATIPAQITTGALKGQVTRSTNGNLVGQAYVTVLDLNGTKLFQTRTNSNGYYSITPIPQGTYNVRFTKSNLITQILVQNIQAGITSILNAIMVPR